MNKRLVMTVHARRWRADRFRVPVMTQELLEFCRRVSPVETSSGRCERCGEQAERRYSTMKTDEKVCERCYLA